MVSDRINATTTLNQESMDNNQHPNMSVYASEQVNPSYALVYNQKIRKQKPFLSSRTVGKSIYYLFNLKQHSILTPLLFVDFLYSGNNEVNQTSSNKKKKTSELKSCYDDDLIDFKVSTKIPTKNSDNLPST